MRRLYLSLALLAAWVGAALGFSGAGSVTAMKNGDFKIRYFNGTQAGIDSAVSVYCAPTGGTVTLGPGLEALAPSVTVPSNVLVIRSGSSGWSIVGNGATAKVPRFGPASTTTTGGAIRIVEGVTFPLTVAGVQAAIDECFATGGGTVMVPANANIVLASTPVVLKNKVALLAFGGKTHDNGSVFKANGSTNVPFAIVAGDTAAGQQLFQLDGITIDGTGGRIDWGIYTKLNFVGSQIVNCRVAKCGRALGIAGTSAGAAGTLIVRNFIATDAVDYLIYQDAGARNIIYDMVELDRPGRNKACFYVNGATTSSAGSISTTIRNSYGEISDSMSVWLRADGAANLEVDGLTVVHPSGRFRAAVQIQNSVPGSFGFSPSGLTIRNLYADSDTLIENQYTGEVITTGADPNNPYRHVSWYSSALSKGSTSANGYRNSGQVIGIQQSKKGPDISSAATIAPHPDGSDFDVTGTTSVTSITGLPYFLWKTTCFWTAAALTITDGGNINAAGNFVGNATGGKDCWCAKWDGTNWNEVSRSIN